MHLLPTVHMTSTSDVMHHTTSLWEAVSKINVDDDLEFEADNDDLFGSTLRLFDDRMPTETNAEMEDTTLKANKYYISNEFRAFHKRYMHLFPLFSGIML